MVFDADEPIGTVIGLIVLAGSLIALPLSRYNTKVNIEEFEARRTSYIEQRELLTDSAYHIAPFIGEQMSISKMVIDDNQWLARKQGAAKRKWFNWYYVPEILDVEPIKFEK